MGRKPRTIQSRLEKDLAALIARADRVEAEMSLPASADSADRAIERENDDVLAAQDALIAHEIAATMEAIRRLAEGRYGMCDACGGRIMPARLAVMPTTTLCISCANEIAAAEKSRD